MKQWVIHLEIHIFIWIEFSALIVKNDEVFEIHALWFILMFYLVTILA